MPDCCGFSSSDSFAIPGIDSIEHCRIVSVWIHHSVEGPRLAATCGGSALGRFILAVFAQTALWFWVAGVCSGFARFVSLTSRTYIIN
jgi:hypothetical protein